MSVTRELNKLAYFEGMGLQLLVAKYPLPGAAPSVPGHPWPPRERAPTAAPRARAAGPQPTSVPRMAPAGAPRLQTVNDSVATAGPESTTATPVAPAGVRRLHRANDSTAVPSPVVSAQAQSVPEFHMAAVVAGDCLWLESVTAGGPAAEQVQLIQAMAFALSGRQETPRLTRFDWPLHQNRQLDLGAAAAATALTSFVLRQLQEQQCRALLLLGATSGERLLSTELEAVVTVSLPATAQMLAQPLCKREAWEALAALCTPRR